MNQGEQLEQGLADMGVALPVPVREKLLAYVALLYRSGGSGDALDVLLAGEQGLVDCMYR